MDNNRFYGGGHSSGMVNDDPGPIPERWLNCPRIARAFVANRFLAFKTPLSARFAQKMEPQQYFQPDMVFSYMKMEKVMTTESVLLLLFNRDNIHVGSEKWRGREREKCYTMHKVAFTCLVTNHVLSRKFY